MQYRAEDGTGACMWKGACVTQPQALTPEGNALAVSVAGCVAGRTTVAALCTALGIATTVTAHVAAAATCAACALTGTGVGVAVTVPADAVESARLPQCAFILSLTFDRRGWSGLGSGSGKLAQAPRNEPGERGSRHGTGAC
jgi:hypothetical protein